MVQDQRDAHDRRPTQELDRREAALWAREDAADARELAQDVRDLELDDRERRLGGPVRDPASAAHLDGLSSRQREVLGLIADGMSNGAIARELFVSINTVKTTIRAVYAKIGVVSRTQAVRWYVHGPRGGDSSDPPT